MAYEMWQTVRFALRSNARTARLAILMSIALIAIILVY
jgi:hypothetical protein